MQNNLNSFNKVTPFTLLLIPLLIVIPKVNLISIPGFWQGIRLEDIITFLILIYMILNSKNYCHNLHNPN